MLVLFCYAICYIKQFLSSRYKNRNKFGTMNNYQNMDHNQPKDSAFTKIRRSLYLIAPITLLTHTLSTTYSIMAFNDQSMGFIAIIVSSLMCFLISSSHLTIYGISVLGVLYVSMIEPYYTRPQICYITAMSGVVIIPFWKIIHSLGEIFHCLPGRIHASMVFGIAIIVLTKFFPLAIENIPAFFISSQSSALTNPFQLIIQTFQNFNVLTLGITIALILFMLLLRKKLAKIPLILILVIIGIAVNWKKHFLSFEDLCSRENVDCNFYILKLENLKTPEIGELAGLIPASLVLTAVLVFQQFLYLEEFQRRGKRLGGQGNLGQVRTQSKVLAVANAISGCLGGLPVCINMFATYENFAYNQKYGFKGTKWVGLLQIPMSYCIYSFLKVFYERIPLFIIFAIVVTPIIYFLRNMLRRHSKNIVSIIILAALNVFTHPIIALILACFISIYDMAQLLRPAPAQIINSANQQGQQQFRGSKIHAVVSQQKSHEDNKFIHEFQNRIIEIGQDIPDEIIERQTNYIVFRLTGTLSYLNFDQHLAELKNIIEKRTSYKFDLLQDDQIAKQSLKGDYKSSPQVFKKEKFTLIISFRYAPVIDDQSIMEFAFFIEQLRTAQIRIVLSGLYPSLIKKMETIPAFIKMVQQDKKCMYSVHALQH